MKLGKTNGIWMEKYDIQYVTICVTEDCNMNCSYCYYINKNEKKTLSVEKGKEIIDFILTNEAFKVKEGVHLEFIGGEPTLEIPLIQELCDYMVIKMVRMKHKWLDRYIFFMTTNGLLYTSDLMQGLLNRHKGHISVVLSIDGIKEKHDLSRFIKNGQGSFDTVSKAIPLWRKQFPNNSNKATFAHNDLRYLRDSIIYLWNLGISNVNANIVFEDVWEEGDTEIYKEQLYTLANYIIDNKMYEEYSVSFFSSSLGHPIPYSLLDTNMCGIGMSIAIDCDGNILPCHRFFECAFSDRKYEKVILGNIKSGFNTDKLRAFNCLSYEYVRSSKCIGCEVATGCSWCVGNNFCESKSDSIFDSVTYKCEMHKINAEVNKYLWNKIQKIQPKGTYVDYFVTKLLLSGEDTKFLYILTGEDMPNYCQYTCNVKSTKIMSDELLKGAEKFCIDNNFIPVVVGNKEIEYPHYSIRKNLKNDTPFQVIVVDIDNYKIINNMDSILIYNITVNNINSLSEVVGKLLENAQRVNLNILDMSKWTYNNCKEYKYQLDCLVQRLLSLRKDNIIKSINVLDDIMYRTRHIGCNAGTKNFTLAPNGKIYVCPAFYYEDEENSVCDFGEDINIINKELYGIEKSVLCHVCDNYHCKRCIFLNKQMVGQMNISPEIQCRISTIERNVAKEFQRQLIEIGKNDFLNIIDMGFDDPIQKIYFRNRYLKDKRKLI